MKLSIGLIAGASARLPSDILGSGFGERFEDVARGHVHHVHDHLPHGKPGTRVYSHTQASFSSSSTIGGKTETHSGKYNEEQSNGEMVATASKTDNGAHLDGEVAVHGEHGVGGSQHHTQQGELDGKTSETLQPGDETDPELAKLMRTGKVD
jgi:hypothetical protein